MKKVALAGATGVVGTRALEHLLENAAISRVVAPGRRAPSVVHEKLAAPVVDMQDEEAIAAALPEGSDAALCALGTTMKKAGSQEAFRAVDLEAVLAFARAALRRGAKRFVLVSSVGADAGSRNFYLRTKGEVEQVLLRLGYPQLTIVRPSFIDDEGRRGEFRAAERLALPLARAAFAVLGRNRRHAPIRADTIGRAIVQLALDETGERVRIVESDRLHAYDR